MFSWGYLESQLLNGLSLGAVYGLIALGFGMVYGVLRVLNFAHSEVFMLSTFAAYFSIQKLVQQEWFGPSANLLIATVAAAMVGGMLAVGLERFAYRPFEAAPRITTLLTAIGASMLLRDVAIHLFSAHTRGFPALSLPLPPKQIALLLVVITYLALELFLRRSDTGISIRAAVDDPQVAALLGIRRNRVVRSVFFIGGALAGIAGVVWGIVYGTVHPQMGVDPSLKAFLISVVGSIGNLRGTFFAAILIGMIECVVAGYVPSDWSAYSTAGVYGALFLFLVLRPQGLFRETAPYRV